MLNDYKINIETLPNTKTFGDSLRDVRFNPEHQSTSAVFSLDGFTGYLSLYDQQELFAEFNIRSLATNYAGILTRVFSELKLHTGYYAPRLKFDPKELPMGIQDVAVSFGEPDGNNYHSAEIVIKNRSSGLMMESTGIKFGIVKKY